MTKPPPNPVFTLKGTMKPVHSLMYDTNNTEEMIYAGTQEGKVHIWDLKDNREITTYSIGKETCLAMHKLDTSDNNCLFITQEKNGQYRFWLENKDRNELFLKKVIDLNYFGFCRSVISVDKNYIICPCNDAAVKLVSITDPENITVIKDYKIDKKVGEIMVIRLSGVYMFVLYESGCIHVWSIDSKDCVCEMNVITNCPMAFDICDHKTKDDRLVGYIGSDSDAVQEINVEISNSKSVIVSKKRELRLTNPGVSCIAIRNDNKLFAVGCWDKHLRLFSCKSLKLLVVLDFHKDVIQDIVFSNNRINCWNCQYLLAVGSIDGRISLWDLY